MVGTSINLNQWPVPVPEGIDLEHDVRRELLNMGAEYVWVDVLCLRQVSAPRYDGWDVYFENERRDEWKLDVPTIGNIYRAAVGIARYFNSLRQSFSVDGWDDSRHWLRRAWTFQEIRSENTTYNAGITSARGHIIMDTINNRNITLRQALHPILKLAAQVDSRSGCSVYKLVKQMAQRYATQPTDKVSGLLYLLRITQLPTYDAGITDEAAWARCFHVLPFERKIEILFDFPYSSDNSTTHGSRWFPAWKQLMEWPEREPAYNHKMARYPQNPAHQNLAEAQKIEHVLVSDIWAIPDVRVCQTEEQPTFRVDIIIGGKTFAFYYPYVCQQPLEESSCERYTLVTTYPDYSYNWVVCESLGMRNEYYTTPGGEKTAEVEVLRKVGVLRTDACSEFVLRDGRSDSILKKINALFI